MENHEIIYNYLQTFPKETTVETLIANMDRANEEFIENHKNQLKLLKEEFVGNVYYYEENDDDKIVCKYITKVKDFNEASLSNFLFNCEIIAITRTEIKFDDDAKIDIRSLKMAKKVDKDLFDKAKELLDGLVVITA